MSLYNQKQRKRKNKPNREKGGVYEKVKIEDYISKSEQIGVQYQHQFSITDLIYYSISPIIFSQLQEDLVSLPY